MDEPELVRDLVAKLMDAVEASLESSPAVRAALDELVRQGFEPRLILLADAAAPDAEADGAEEPADDADEAEVDDEAELEGPAEPRDPHDLRYGLTPHDREFLRTVRIRPESS
jgi:hypothetical protein